MNNNRVYNQPPVSTFGTLTTIRLDSQRKRTKGIPTPIMAVPWTPPAWMKYNNSFGDGSTDETDGRLMCEHYGTLAQWLYNWTYYYRDTHGLNIKWLSIQNEPNANVKWDNCHYDAQEMGKALWTTVDFFRSKGSTVAIGGPECGHDKSAHEYLDGMSPEILEKMDWTAHHGYQQIRQSKSPRRVLFRLPRNKNLKEMNITTRNIGIEKKATDFITNGLYLKNSKCKDNAFETTFFNFAQPTRKGQLDTQQSRRSTAPIFCQIAVQMLYGTTLRQHRPDEDHHGAERKTHRKFRMLDYRPQLYRHQRSVMGFRPDTHPLRKRGVHPINDGNSAQPQHRPCGGYLDEKYHQQHKIINQKTRIFVRVF